MDFEKKNADQTPSIQSDIIRLTKRELQSIIKSALEEEREQFIEVMQEKLNDSLEKRDLENHLWNPGMLIGVGGGDSCGNSVRLETSDERSEGGGSSHARGKHPPAPAVTRGKYFWNGNQQFRKQKGAIHAE